MKADVQRRLEMSADQTDTIRIGVLGGSFDPIHIGHLMAAEGAREALQLSRVLFIPARISPHKLDAPPSGCGDADRLEMLRLAVEDNPHFAPSDIELRRGGVSYTVETVEHLIDEFGVSAELFLLVGTDAVAEMHLWKDIERLLDLCAVVPISRPGAAADYTALAERVGREKADAVRSRTLDIPLVAVSSTEIRERLCEGRSVRYQVSASVENYIRDNDLYSAR